MSTEDPLDTHSSVGLGIGEYVRNKKTGVRGDVMGFLNNYQIRVVRHPSDIQAGSSRWQTWELEDVERVPNEQIGATTTAS